MFPGRGEEVDSATATNKEKTPKTEAGKHENNAEPSFKAEQKGRKKARDRQARDQVVVEQRRERCKEIGADDRWKLGAMAE
ncbi:hypothetical protein KI387_009434, partial [Taxus chinensis]